MKTDKKLGDFIKKHLRERTVPAVVKTDKQRKSWEDLAAVYRVAQLGDKMMEEFPPENIAVSQMYRYGAAFVTRMIGHCTIDFFCDLEEGDKNALTGIQPTAETEGT